MTDSIPLCGWRVSPLEAFRQADFVEAMLASDGVGNVPRGAAWATEEGFLNATGRYCDAFADWWPDDTLPVGYHATTLCLGEDNGYRTFDSAFAVERSPGEFTLVYQHDLTRQASVVDTQVGGGGVCRASNLGLPLVQTNNMRICTMRQGGADVLDIAVPASPASSPYGQEVCSGDSTDIPWFDPTGTMQDSALHSVGTVPNMPPPSSATYPAAVSDAFGIGPEAQVQADLAAGGNGWGAGCSDFAIEECASARDCPAGYFCLQGVCMHGDFETGARCYNHAMCGDKMCDGTGACTQAFVVYLNNVTDPMEATVFATARQKCVMDVKALPPYAALCQNNANILNACTCTKIADPVGCTPVLNWAAVQQICPNIQTVYTASYTTVASNVKYLQQLFNVFVKSAGTLQAQVSGTRVV